MKRLESNRQSSIEYSLTNIPSEIIIDIFIILYKSRDLSIVCFIYSSFYIKNLLLSTFENIHIELKDILDGFSYKCSLKNYSSILKWAIKNGCPWNERTCSYAAKEGNFELLKWLRKKGCPWNDWTFNYAAAGGYLDILIWLKENGCEWSSITASMADDGYHADILKWLIENGCPYKRRCCKNKCISNGKPCIKNKFCYDRHKRMPQYWSW